MNYFIDFEATQFSEEVISVGCVREDGETFYSLVAPVEGKITPFITNLTGITAEMLQNALSPDHVFENFYDWALENDECPNFFVWGNNDVDFLRHTFKRTNSRKARIAIGYMCGSIVDYAKIFCKTVKTDSCSLIKAYNGLIDANKAQNHNALDDAMLLFEVHKAVGNMTVEELKEKMGVVVAIKTVKPAATVVPTWNQCGFAPGTICIINAKKIATNHWDTLDEAAEWVLDNYYKNPDISIERAKSKIKSAYSNGKKFFNMTWRRVV